ncbi:MAG: alkaline phosphatase family protein [Deltaproteobacteria bacterium]|nr:alkaline phosphatase family protein [Deltaproteobacteria bacterium]
MLKCCFLFFPLLFVIACATNRAVELYPLKRAKEPIADRYVFMIVIDGPRVDDMEKLVEEGKLPTIRKTFFENGARFKNSTSVFPSSSSSGHQSIMTGLFPGRNGVPALSWVDRANKKVVEYLRAAGLKRLNTSLFNFRRLFNPNAEFSDTPHMLYTALDGHPTFNSFEQASFGATRFQPKFLLPYGWQYAVARDYEYTDVKAAEKTVRFLSEARLENFPRVTATAFYTVDMLLHEEEPVSERIVNAYRHIDVFLRELKGLLAKKGVLDKSVFILTGDHGFHVTEEKQVSLRDLLQKEGMNAKDSPSFGAADVIVTGRAISSNTLYLKLDKEWEREAFLEDWEATPSKSHPGKNIVEGLIDHPGIEWIIGRRKDSSVEARTKSGRARIYHTRINGEDFYQYEVPAGFVDPFSHNSPHPPYVSPVLRQKEGRFFEGNGHPDAIVLASSLFDDGRAEGIYVALDPGWNIRRKKRGNHGSLDSEDIRVPLWFSGSGIRPGKYVFGRTVDIYPTVISLFGLSFDARDTDGRVLTEILESPPGAITRASSASFTLAGIELELLRKGHVSGGRAGSLALEAKNELQRRLIVEENIQKWEGRLRTDYGDALDKSSPKGIKARQILRSLRHAKELATESRERMEKICH